MKVLVLSLGGSPEPLRVSLAYHHPDKAVLFASESSAAQIKALAMDLPEIPAVLTCANPNDVQECFSVAKHCLERAFIEKEAEVVVDFTGGTKTMAAALVLACAERDVLLSYVGGGLRMKDGLGAVADGSEAVICRAMRDLREQI